QLQDRSLPGSLWFLQRHFLYQKDFQEPSFWFLPALPFLQAPGPDSPPQFFSLPFSAPDPPDCRCLPLHEDGRFLLRSLPVSPCPAAAEVLLFLPEKLPPAPTSGLQYP